MLKKIIFTLYFIVLVVALFALPRLSLGANDNATIAVNITSIAQITLYPDILNWTAVLPGNAGGQKLLDIRNTGSLNVSNIYAFVSTVENETSRPYGLGASNYAATGMIVFRNESDTTYYYAGRLEWNWTEDISNKNLAALGNNGCTDPGNCSWGFVRNTSYEYMWAFSNGTDGLCNNTGALLAFEDEEDDGSSGTRTPETGQIYYEGGDDDFGYFNVSRATQPLLYESCVAVASDCTKMYIYKYDKRTTPNDFTTCQYTIYIQEPELSPTQEHTLRVDAYIPYGTPFGQLATGVFTVVAS